MSARPFLGRRNPLATVLAVVPALVVCAVVRDPARPAFLLVAAVLVVLLGARPRWRVAVAVLLVPPAAVGLLSLSFGAWSIVDPPDHSAVVLSLGAFQLTSAMWAVGLTSAARLVAAGALCLVPGLASSGAELVRAAVQAGVPMRLGYTALVGMRFVPRFRDDLRTIRRAQRARGTVGARGPLGGVRRALSPAIPLLAGGIRHAERTALAMDARGFGAHPTRTERHRVPSGPWDAVWVAAAWTVTAAVVLLPA